MCDTSLQVEGNAKRRDEFSVIPRTMCFAAGSEVRTRECGPFRVLIQQSVLGHRTRCSCLRLLGVTRWLEYALSSIEVCECHTRVIRFGLGLGLGSGLG